MSPGLSRKILREKNDPSANSAWIFLIDFYFPNRTTVFHYAKNSQDVTFGGNVYAAADFGLKNYTTSSKGEIPSISLAVSNVGYRFDSYYRQNEYFVGSYVVMRRVNTNCLTETFDTLTSSFTVSASKINRFSMTLDLVSHDALTQEFPKHRFVANYCRYYRYFKGPECGYSGTKTTCNGTLDNCRERANNVRFGGFPSLRDGSLRLA